MVDGISRVEEVYEQHTVSRSIILHLVPGVLLVLCYTGLALLFTERGYPSMLALFMAIPLSSAPFQLGWLLYEGKKKNGKLSLKGIITYQEKLSLKHYFKYVPALIIWGVIWLGALPLVLDGYILKNIFFWLPSWFNVAGFVTNIKDYNQGTLLIMVLLGIIFNGLLGPVVEELYFRGYLLPRLSRFKEKGALMNALLFSVYHFHRPWQLLNMILFVSPMAYLVYKHRSVKLGIATHVLLNVFSMVSLLPLILIEV